MRRILLALLLVGTLGATIRAMFIMPELQNVPVDRLIENLERQLAQEPESTSIRLNLARLHAMAFATKSETAPVTTGRPYGPPQAPWFGFDPGSFRDVRVQPAATPQSVETASAHLRAAIAVYEAIVRREPDHAVAKLGRAWCIGQSGDKSAAIAAYRDALQTAWAKESAGQLPRIQNYMPVTAEIVGYLIPLLDHRADADEIADLQAKRDRIRTEMQRRPITPVAIPLRSGMTLADLVDRSAAVPFDADGSGIQQRWSWITQDAGWLVFDRKESRQVTSALQWFGSVTFWLFWNNGYTALRALDDNDDGELTGRELDGLAIWRDGNSNGLSEAGEVKPLADWNVIGLSTRSLELNDEDAIAMSPAGATFRDGSTRPTYDVLLYSKK